MIYGYQFLNRNHRHRHGLIALLVMPAFLACGTKAPQTGGGRDTAADEMDGDDTASQGEQDSMTVTPEDSDSDGDTEADTGLGGCGEVDTTLAEMDADRLFDWPNVPTFDIYLPPAEWAELQIDARDEEYVEAEACFEGRAIGTVGLRFKGSFGSLYSCFDENDDMICRKLGMKLKFSEYDLEKRFFGMKRLNFQGNRWDDTYMKETLSYDLYRAMDIDAPRSSWAQIRVNDELMGLFGMVEQIDGRFTDDRWPDNGDGNLYKEVWPVNTDESYILSRLKTNEEVGDVSALIAFSEAVLAADPADRGAVLDNFVDLDYWARYMAVDDAIANYDGITTYWTSGDAEWAGNHNFYLYEEASDLFTIIPWDLESTFRVGGFGTLPRWTEVPEDCSIVYTIWGNDDDMAIAPGCDPIFQGLAQNIELYQAAGQTLLDGPFSEENLNAAIDDHVSYIRDAVDADPRGPGLVEFDKSVSFVRNEVPLLRARLAHFLTGEPWTPFEIAVDEVTDFEAQDDFGLIMTAEVYASEGTTIQYAINAEDPLFGARDLRLTFQFSEQGETWVSYEVPMTSGANDVRALTGIRLFTRADRARDFRIEVDSPHTTAENDWIRVGWDFEVSDEVTEHELVFREAAIPWWAEAQGLALTVTLDEILSAINGVIFRPENGANGDSGFVDIDNIEFY